MRDMKKFDHNKRILLKKHKCCEKCGRTIGLEVHHIKPSILGGSDELENLQVLCNICHKDIHKENRSELIKIGQERVRHITLEPLISITELYVELQHMVDNGNVPDVIDVLDVVDNLPVRHYLKVYKEDM